MKRILLLFLSITLLWACNNNTATSTNEVDYTSVKIPEFVADSAYRYVAEQLQFGFRSPGSIGHQQCAMYLANKMRQWCDTVIIQNFSTTLWNGETYQGQNIIASLNPEKEKRVLLGAHWDSRLWADHDPNTSNHKKPIMGANDGASGVGTLMEMARIMSQQRPEMGIDIIFFDMEDQGIPEWENTYKDNTWCLGSQYWAKNPHRPFYTAHYGILFDMVGTRTPRYTREEFSRHYAYGLVDKIWKAAAQTGAGNVFVNIDSDAILDDHLYVNRIINIPMIDIVQNSEQCSFFPHWHTIEDNLDCISAESMKITADVVLKVLYQ